MGADTRRHKEIELKRNDIIDAAEKLFFSKGYENTSMDEVAKEAEYSKRTLYAYFNSKEQIYFEIMIRGYRLLIATLEDALRKEAPADSIEELRLLFFTLFKFSTQYRAYLQAIMEYETKEWNEQAEIDSQSRDTCYQLGETLFDILARVLRKGKANGSLRQGLDCEKTALVLWSCTIGIFAVREKKSSYLTDYHQTEPDALLSEAADLLIRSIAA